MSRRTNRTIKTTLTADNVQEIRDYTGCPNCEVHRGKLCKTLSGIDMPNLVHGIRAKWHAKGWRW